VRGFPGARVDAFEHRADGLRLHDACVHFRGDPIHALDRRVGLGLYAIDELRDFLRGARSALRQLADLICNDGKNRGRVRRRALLRSPH